MTRESLAMTREFLPEPVYVASVPLTGWRKFHDIVRYYFWWYANHIYVRSLFGLRIEGWENIPKEGPVILASNHISFLDANIISAASPRKIAFMIAREWYEMGAINWLCRFLGCIPVNRNGQDIAAVKSALKALSHGALVGCFPEGGISQSGELQEAKLGVALIAIRSGVPVVPVNLSGYKFQNTLIKTFFTPKSVRIKIGPAMCFAGEDARDRESLMRVSRQLEDALRELVVESE